MREGEERMVWRRMTSDVANDSQRADGSTGRGKGGEAEREMNVGKAAGAITVRWLQFPECNGGKGCAGD